MQHSVAFEEALVYAARLHAKQRRKASNVPYVAHLLAVTALVLEHGGRQDEAIAALLHDAVEDQGGAATRDEILRRFGPRVAEIVDGCTDADCIPKPPWQARKETFVARLKEAPLGVRLVVAADKLHNARSILCDYRSHGEVVWNRFTGGRGGTLWYYQAVVAALAGGEPAALVAELARTTDDLVRLAASQANE